MVRNLPVYNADSGFFLSLLSDLYLARLITSKQIIQPYVDDFFNTLLLEKTGQPVPPPIKYLFDFLDQDALHSLNKNQTLTTVKFRVFFENWSNISQ